MTFLKWFTTPEQNLRFTVATGYLPVTYAASETKLMDQTLAADAAMTPMLAECLRIGADMTRTYALYTSKPCRGGTQARKIVEHSLPDKAAADRAAVEEAIAGGMTRVEAVAQLDSDENFDAWYQDFCQALSKAFVQ